MRGCGYSGLLEMSSRNPSVSTPSPLRVASGRVVKKYQRIRAFSAELDRGYCLQAQLQSAAFRSSYVLGSHVAQYLPNQLRFGRDRDRGRTVPITGLGHGPARLVFYACA